MSSKLKTLLVLGQAVQDVEYGDVFPLAGVENKPENSLSATLIA